MQAFLLTELGTSGSVDAANQLIIKGRFQQKQIESVLRKYISKCITMNFYKNITNLLFQQRNMSLVKLVVLPKPFCKRRLVFSSYNARLAAQEGLLLTSRVVSKLSPVVVQQFAPEQHKLLLFNREYHRHLLIVNCSINIFYVYVWITK